MPIRLEDLIPSYPENDDPKLQRKLAVKPEFSELSGGLKEALPAPGEYYRHQRAVLRFMRVYDRLLMFHAMGTGKSGGSKSIGSFYKRKYYPLPSGMSLSEADRDVDMVGFVDVNTQMAMGLPAPGTFAQVNACGGPVVGVSAAVDALVEFMNDWDTDIRHMFIIVKGENLVKEFQRQIAFECAEPGEFSSNEDAPTEAAKQGRIRGEIKRWFTVTTQTKFVRKYLMRDGALMDKAELKRRYSNCAFVVDEVQTLYNETRDGRKDTSRPRKGKTYDDSHKFNYDALDLLFHVVENSKVILSTGTPMVNTSNEIKSVMNLILPEEKKMPRSMNVDTMTDEELEPYFRGRTSYVRGTDTGADTVLQGDHFKLEYKGRLIESEDVVYMTQMSEFQSSVYESIMNDSEIEEGQTEEPDEEWEGVIGGDYDDETLEAMLADIEETAAENKRTAVNEIANRANFQGPELSAALFVFPDGSIRGSAAPGRGDRMASNGLGRYVYNPEAGVYRPTTEFRAMIDTPDKIRRYSCVFGEIVERSLNDEGKTFVYMGKHVDGAGANLLGVCMEANGLEQYNGAVSAVEVLGGKDLQLSDVADPTAGDPIGVCLRQAGRRRIRIPKKDRFAVITSLITPARISAILELYNSPENVHGEYLRVIIASEVFQLGHNINNTVNVHTTSGWNASTTEQAIARALRSAAYVQLLSIMREQYAIEGKNPDDAKVEVKIYKHAAMPRDPDVLSIDLHRYAISERKDRSISRIARNIQRSAFDCVINYKRNRIIGRDGSRECDYMECEYECFAPPLTGREGESEPVSAMWLTTRNGRLDELAESIAYHLVREPSLRISELASRLGTAESRVAAAVALLETSGRVFLDRFGRPCVVRASNVAGVATLTRSFAPPTDDDGDAFSGYYTSSLHSTIITPTLTTSIVAAAINGGGLPGQAPPSHTDAIAAQFERFDVGDVEAYLERAPAGVEISLFEAASESIRSPNSRMREIAPIEKSRAVVAHFAKYLYALAEPTKDLRRAEEELARRGRGRGRKAKLHTQVTLNFEVETANVLTEFMAARMLNQCNTMCPDGYVFLHTMNSRSSENTSYAVASQLYGVKENIRVLSSKESPPRWRDASLTEMPVYRAIIDRQRESEMMDYGELYGTIAEDRYFRIVDRSSEEGTKNKRKQARGRDCSTWPIHLLVGAAFRAGVPLNAPKPPRVQSETRVRLLAEWTKRSQDEIRAIPEEQQRYEYAWWYNFRETNGKFKHANAELCQSIQTVFRNKNLLLEI